MVLLGGERQTYIQSIQLFITQYKQDTSLITGYL